MKNTDGQSTPGDVFGREGWLLVRQLVEPSTLDALLRATRALELVAAPVERDTLVKGVFFEVQSQSGRKREAAVFPGALRKITAPSKAEPAFAKLRKDRHILAAIEACGVYNPQCIVDQLNFKLPHVGTCFPYHQDETFLFGEARERVQRGGGINVVVALDPMDASNGGFEVLGRTHLRGLVDHSYDSSTMNAGVFDESFRVVPELAAGDAVLFHPRLAHGSGRNQSERPRRLVTLWYGGSAGSPNAPNVNQSAAITSGGLGPAPPRRPTAPSHHSHDGHDAGSQ